MHPQPLDKKIRKSNAALALSLAALVLVLMGIAVFFVSPEAAAGTESFLSGMR
jgi:hypothetical protein